MSAPKLFPTTLVGSYPQPDWLIDRQMLLASMPPRTRLHTLWRVDPQWLQQAQDDATVLAIRDQENAGLDIITDGEMRRESYSNRFATALEGIDLDRPGTKISRTGAKVEVPRCVAKIRRTHAVNVRDVQFLRANTNRQIKITVPGPFTMTKLTANDYYASDPELALDYAGALNAEIKDLFAAGADVVQIDEPYLQANPVEARQYALPTLERMLDGITGTTALHTCFGYAALVKGRPAGYSFLTELNATSLRQVSIETAQANLDCSILSGLDQKTILLGVLDLSTQDIETPEIVAARIRRALPFIKAQRLIIAPDCGLKYLNREVAFGKIKAMAEGAKIVRAEVTSELAQL